MGVAMSTRRSMPCPESYGICVSAKQRSIILADCRTLQLHIYSLINGTAMRSVGSPGSGKGQFSFGGGGLCTSPDGDSVLVADFGNHRVQEVRIVDGSWVRFVGRHVLKWPQRVDCNADVIVVSGDGYYHISVLSWSDGSVRAQFGSIFNGWSPLSYPNSVRRPADDSGLVVTDIYKNTLTAFTLGGQLVAAVRSGEQGVNGPCDVLECAPNTSSSIILNICAHTFISQNGGTVEVYGQRGIGDGEAPYALAQLPNDGCLVVEYKHVQQLVSRHARLTWMRACASCSVGILAK
jgi:hypothetical protein